MNLPKIVTKSARRVGRGHGSGRVKTAGRGTKGQNARGTNKPGFEGGQLQLIKRLPLLRGKGRNHSQQVRMVVVDIGKLSDLPAKSKVDLVSLVKAHIIDESVRQVKIIGSGPLEVALNVVLPTTQGAKKAIEAAGGTVIASS